MQDSQIPVQASKRPQLSERHAAISAHADRNGTFGGDQADGFLDIRFRLVKKTGNKVNVAAVNSV